MVNQADIVLKQTKKEVKAAVASLDDAKRLVRILEDMGESVIEEKRAIKEAESKGKLFIKAIKKDKLQQGQTV